LYMSRDAGGGSGRPGAVPHRATGHRTGRWRRWPGRAAPRHAGPGLFCRNCLNMRPGLPEAHLALGEVYAGAFQWPKAEEEFRVQVKLQPGNAEAAYRLGQALLEEGKVQEARAELLRADKLMPDMPETPYSLGKAASLEGDAAAAEKAWTRLLSIEKQSSLAAQAHFGLAGLYRKQGKSAEAQREMQEFQKLQSSTQRQASGAQDSQH
jgi:tetratricopeptide (TPR) repeat protein